LHFFIDSMINQLMIEHEVNRELIIQFIGEIKFFPTNNDKSNIACINQRIFDIEYQKYQFDDFEYIPFYSLGSHMNEIDTVRRNNRTIYIQPSKEFLKHIEALSKG
jgi:hypothetical protein